MISYCVLTFNVICKKRVQTSNKKGFNRNRLFRAATKRTETSPCPPKQCTYIPNSLCAVVQQIEDVSALLWRTGTCFCPFVAVLNTLFLLKLFHYLFLLIMDVIIRIATKTKWPPHLIYYASNAYISDKMWTLALPKADLWSTTDSKFSWIINRHKGHRQGMKPESGKIANCYYSYSSSSYSRKILYSTTTQSG